MDSNIGNFVLRITFLGSSDFFGVVCDHKGSVLRFKSSIDAMAFWMDYRDDFDVEDKGKSGIMFGAMDINNPIITSAKFLPLLRRENV